MKTTFAMDIDAPAERIFDLIYDPEKHKQWLMGVEETSYLPGYDPTNPIGGRFKQKIREGGRVQEYEGEVTAYAPPKHLGIRLFAKPFSVQVDYRLTPLLKGTRLDYSADVSCNSWFFRMMAHLFAWFCRRILRKQMAKLQELAERCDVPG